jgi:hypothetical protein
MNELLIIFTKNDSDTQLAYFDLLFPSNGLGTSWKFVNFDYNNLDKDKFAFKPDVILINDEISFEQWQSICSKKFHEFIQNAGQIFVVYHGNPNNQRLSNQQHGVQIKDHLVSTINNSNQSKKYFHTIDHHNLDGKVIRKVKELVVARRKSQGDYHTAFNEIIKQ